MTDTIVADVLDKLYDTWVADATLAAMVTSKRLRIFDGPAATDFAADSMLVVGALPVVDDESETSVAWEWASLGVSGAFAEIDEVIQVPCGVASRRGSNDSGATIRAIRRSAISVYAAASSALRGSQLTLPQVMWCMSNVSSIKQLQTADGPECLVAFTAYVRTLI